MSARPAISTRERDQAHRAAIPRLEHASVAVLFGGRSSEREVSLTSGRMVLRALRTPASADDRRGPARAVGIEILRDGRWRVGPRDLAPAAALAALDDFELFFFALHGGEGENGAVQGLLTCCERAFTGSGVGASAICMDKVFAREIVAAGGLRVARARGVGRSAWRSSPAEVLRELAPLTSGGCVVKPRSGGSSVGCTLVRRPGELSGALERALEWGDAALVEELVRGVEVTGGVLQAPSGELLALPPVEIRPRGEFFDYREKYSADGALELCPPESLSTEATARVRAAALEAHLRLGCAGYSRTDFIVPPREAEPVFLETNTLPGLTPRSLLPRAAEALGVDYRTLCLWIASDGLCRRRDL